MSLYAKLLSEPLVHIDDDFYSDLAWLESHLEQVPFRAVQDANYVGLQSRPPLNLAPVYDRIQDILGVKIHASPVTDGVLRCQRLLDAGQEKTFIHFDLNRLNILIYLSDSPDSHSENLYGTHFYEHKILKKNRFISFNNSKDDFQRQMVYEDTHNEEAWTKWFTVPYKKNRALIFDGNLFHSGPRQFFGDQVGNSRLTQNFFPLITL